MIRVIAYLIVFTLAAITIAKVAFEAGIGGLGSLEDDQNSCKVDLAWVSKWNGFREQCCTFGVIHFTYDPSTGNSHVTTHPTQNSLTLCKYLTEPGVACRISQECISRTCFLNKTCA